MKRKDYYDKLKEWEAEGYDVSELRQKWFPARRGKGGSRARIWLPVIAAVFIVVAGIVVWQATQPAPTTVPAVRLPSPAPTPAQTLTPVPAQVPTVVARYTLATSSNPGSAGSISPSSGTYNNGTSVTIIATAAPGYRFDHWSGDFSGTSPTIVLAMDSNKNVVANFLSIRYSLSTVVSPMGSGSISPIDGSYDSGTQVALTAIPSSGWRFDHWSGTDDNSVNPSTVTMTGSKNITAYFIAQDTDGDGLTDDEERQIGTNPSYADTDHDGLNDYEEVKVKKTDPLSPDTDGDGVQDGNDLFPLYDAYVRVAITYFESTGTLSDEAGYQEAYFIITVNGESKRSSSSTELIDGRYLKNPYSATFNIPDETQYVSVSIAAWDSDFFVDDHYDTSDNPQLVDYETRYNITGGTFTHTSDGAVDGGLQGPQGKIIVEITTIS